jgi:hypothetical protein
MGGILFFLKNFIHSDNQNSALWVQEIFMLKDNHLFHPSTCERFLEDTHNLLVGSQGPLILVWVRAHGTSPWIKGCNISSLLCTLKARSWKKRSSFVLQFQLQIGKGALEIPLWFSLLILQPKYHQDKSQAWSAAAKYYVSLLSQFQTWF